MDVVRRRGSISIPFLLGLVFLALTMTGCFAAGARAKAMMPEQIEVGTQHPSSVSLAVQGGQETNPFYESEISNEAFIEALQDALSKSGIFTKVSQSSEADYRLEVLLDKVHQPILSLATTVTLETHWKLMQVNSGKIVWQEFIKSSYEAAFLPNLYGVARLRVANEGAARENINEGIRLLSIAHF